MASDDPCRFANCNVFTGGKSRLYAISNCVSFLAFDALVCLCLCLFCRQVPAGVQMRDPNEDEEVEFNSALMALQPQQTQRIERERDEKEE